MLEVLNLFLNNVGDVGVGSLIGVFRDNRILLELSLCVNIFIGENVYVFLRLCNLVLVGRVILFLLFDKMVL